MPSFGAATITLNLSPVDLFKEAALGERLGEEFDDGDSFESLHFSAGLTADTTVRIGFDASPARQFNELSRIGTDSSLFFATEGASAPQLTMLGRGHGFSVESVLDDRTRFYGGMFTSKGEEESGPGEGSLAQMVVTRDFGGEDQLAVGLGILQERDALFRTTATGAFEEPASTGSGLMTLSFTESLTPCVKVQASYTEAWARPSKVEYGYLRNWSQVQANAATLSLTVDDVFDARDRIGFMVGQPLRVYRAEADLTLPVSRDLEGFVQHETRRVEVTPSGREIDLQAAYEIRQSDTLTVSSFATLKLNPGHDNRAQPIFGAGLKLNMRF